MNIKLIPYELPFAKEWRSARGLFSQRKGWLIRIQSDEGFIGWGDCAPMPDMGSEHEADALAFLMRFQFESGQISIEDAMSMLDESADQCPAAFFGVETALLDLLSQNSGLSIASLLDDKAASSVQVNAALGAIMDISSNRIDTAVDAGFNILKVKLGIGGFDEELGKLKQICRALPDGVQFRVDANQAWSLEEAKRLLHAIELLPVESIEEPLCSPDIQALRTLREFSAIPIAADESISTLDADALIQAEAVDRLVLKPALCGGLRRSLHISRLAETAGISTVVTTLLESAVGVWAAVQLAAAVDPDGQFSHGLVTSSWFAQDVGQPPEIVDGMVEVPFGARLGSLTAMDTVANETL